MAKQKTKLPKKVLAAFDSAREGLGTHIWVPSVVAWGISQLMRKTHRISALGTFEELITENFYFKGLNLTDLQAHDLVIARSLSFNRDPFDALVVATACRLELPLITADSDVTD